MIKVTPVDAQVNLWINPEEVALLEEHFPIESDLIEIANQQERYTVILLKNGRTFAVKETGEELVNLIEPPIDLSYLKKFGLEEVE